MGDNWVSIDRKNANFAKIIKDVIMGLGLYYLGLFVIFLFSIYAQVKVWGAIKRYSKVPNSLGLSGKEFVEKAAKKLGIPLKVTLARGWLGDYFDPRTNTIALSKSVYYEKSVAALGVAAHELGHAIQKKEGYFWMWIRSALVPIVPIGTYLGYFLIILGLAINALGLAELGLLLFGLMVVFTGVTLPVEFDASRRAYRLLKEWGMPAEELQGVKSVLTAAALTYVAAFASALWSFLRMALIVFGGRRD